MKHVFHMKADFINGATAIMATPEMRWCDLDNWVYYMGIREYCIIAVDDKRYQDRWRHVPVEKNQDGKETIILGENFFLSDWSKVWKCSISKKTAK